MKRAVLLAVAALVAAPPATSHPGTAEQGYVSTVSGLSPQVLGVVVSVLGGDDRLSLRNWSGKTVVVEGYEGEPYLRFAEDGVFRNERSPAAYLNRDRFALAEPPAEADPAAAPRWVKVAGGTSYAWHDHRIHWMKQAPPSGVRQNPERVQRIFSWKVPATADGHAFTIQGFLGYAPPAEERQEASAGGGGGVSFGPGAAALAGFAALIAALAALPFVLRRRTKAPGGE